MPFSDSNRVGLRYIQESQWGVTPSGGVFKAINFTNESLKSTNNTVTSETIRDDRNISDRTIVGGGAGGDTGFELRYNDIDALIAGALNEAWVTTVMSSATCSASFSGAKIVADSSVANNMVVGQIFRVKNATSAANDGDLRVLAVSTVAEHTALTCAIASSGASAAFTGEVFASATTAQGKNIRNGTTKSSFTLEKVFNDISEYHRYAGMRVTSMGLDMTSQSILTGTFGFTGKSQVATSATVASAVTDAAVTTVMNASGNVGAIWEGGQAVTGVAFQAISFTLDNGPREQTKVGSNTLAGVGLGTCNIEGSFNAYFENNDLVQKYVAGTATNLRFQVDDLDGNTYVIDIPKVRLMDCTITAEGPNNDVMQDISWGAIVDSTGTYAIQIDALDV